MTLKCVVTDDEPIARKGLLGYIDKIDFLEVAAECENALQLNHILKTHSVDLLFLDIEMPYMSGIELLSSLVNPPKVIITSAYEQYAIKGYDLDVVDYLLKPISFERFLKATNKVYDIIVNSHKNVELFDYFYVKTNQKYEKIGYKDILYIESIENYVAIQTQSLKIITHATLKSILERLPVCMFIQTHKSFIVNIQNVSFVEGNMLGIAKYKIPISRTFKAEVLQVVLQNRLQAD